MRPRPPRTRTPMLVLATTGIIRRAPPTTCTKAKHREHTHALHANAVAITTSITRHGTIPAQQ